MTTKKSKKIKSSKSSNTLSAPSYGNDVIKALQRMNTDMVKTQIALHMSEMKAENAELRERIAKLEEQQDKKTDESPAKASRGPQKVSLRFFTQKLLKYAWQTTQGKDVADKFKKGPLITTLLLEKDDALNKLLEQASRAFVKLPSEALMSNSFTNESLFEWIEAQRAQASFADLFACLDRLIQCSVDELNAQLPSKDEASSSASGQKRKATSEAQDEA